HTGARIAHLRDQRNLTQQGLAMRAHVSRSLVAQVESGHKAASPAFVAACARALAVPIGALTGAANPQASEDQELRARIEGIRSTLDLYDLPPEEDVRPRPLRELRAAVRD